MQKTSALQRYLEISKMPSDPMLRIDLQHKMMKEEYHQCRYEEELIEKIAQKVLEAFSIRADTTDAITEIEALDEAIKKLQKGGK